MKKRIILTGKPKTEKAKAPNFIKEAQAKLVEHFNAQVTEKIMSILASKGFVFDRQEDVFSFFRDRIKSFKGDNDYITLALDEVPFMAYKSPNFKQDKFDITIGLEYVEL